MHISIRKHLLSYLFKAVCVLALRRDVKYLRMCSYNETFITFLNVGGTMVASQEVMQSLCLLQSLSLVFFLETVKVLQLVTLCQFGKMWESCLGVFLYTQITQILSLILRVLYHYLHSKGWCNRSIQYGVRLCFPLQELVITTPLPVYCIAWICLCIRTVHSFYV